MDKIKKIITSPLFISGVATTVGIVLITELHPLYAGIAFGIGIVKFLGAFKSS